MQSTVILLSGACFVGKTFIKSAWLKKNDHNFKWFGGSFAQALKDEMHEQGLIDKKKLTDALYKATVRKAMQDYGQEKRKENKFYLAQILENKMKDVDSGATYVIDDWRFLSEAEYFETMGYKVVRLKVIRPVELMIESVGHSVVIEYLENHSKDISERELDNEYRVNANFYDNIIFNNQNGTSHLINKLQEIENAMNKAVKYES